MDLMDYIADVADFPSPGIVFKDITPLLENPPAFAYCIDAMVDLCDAAQIDKIAALDARGFIFAAPLALRLEKSLVLVRKAGKLPRSTVAATYKGEYATVDIEVHRSSIVAGDRFLIVDDVSATGNSLATTAGLIEQRGGSVTAMIVLMHFLNLGAPERLVDHDIRYLLAVDTAE
jgi:adenine phosphoribosyltransferase